MHHIFVISDGTGNTAMRALEAALTQFTETSAKINLFSEVRTKRKASSIIKKAAEVKAFILHTVVSADLRKYILEISRLHSVETIDLMGPLLAQLSNQLQYSPLEKPGLFYELNKAYFQRIEAMEFAFRHDDGQRVEELDKAELVLVGVSRTFKTPLSIFFAFRGWMVANVPIILNIDPPPVLSRIRPSCVFFLTTDAARLAILRRSRHFYLGGATGDYANPVYIRKELDYAESIYRNHPLWTKINVTNKPIEEIASEILSVIRRSGKSIT
jgi:regulator of PEP synthase PpsR (kinase-PPPase family)